MTSKTITQKEAHEIFKKREPKTARMWARGLPAKGQKGSAPHLAAMVVHVPGFVCSFDGERVLAQSPDMRVEIVMAKKDSK